MNDFNGTFERTDCDGIAKYIRNFTTSNGNEASAIIAIYDWDDEYYMEFYRCIQYPDDYNYYHEFTIASSDPYDLSAMDSDEYSSESLSMSEDKNTITLTY